MSTTEDRQAYSNRDQETQEANKPVEGERKLLTAILSRAIEDLSNSEGAISQDAYQWFTEESPDDPPVAFSYLYVCENLGFDPEALFTAIKAKLAQE